MNPNPHSQPNQPGQPMALHKVIDEQHQGIVVSIFEHPEDWQAQSQVVWNFQNISLPVQVYASAFNPEGLRAIEFWPVEAFYWLDPDYGTETIGQSLYGLIAMPPMSAVDAMMRCVIPKYRGNCRNLRIMGVEPVPNLPQILGDSAAAQLPRESICVRLEYEANGRVLEEEFYGVKSQNRVGGAMQVQINWGFGRLFCFHAERGQLEAARETFWQILRSLQINPQWQELHDQIMQQLSGEHRAVYAGFMAKLEGEKRYRAQLEAYNQEQLDRRKADLDWRFEMDKRRQQMLDPTRDPVLTARERFRNELGGETAYHDPNSPGGNYIYRPSNEQATFINDRGEIVGSPDSNFDPTIGSTDNWTRLRKA